MTSLLSVLIFVAFADTQERFRPMTRDSLWMIVCHVVRRVPQAVGWLSIALMGGVVGLFCLMPGASAQDASNPTGSLRFLQIATGPTGGTYFPIGGLIATAISFPPGSRPCDKGGSCGVPGVMAVAQSTRGSVNNIEALHQGMADLALVQADLAHWAYTGAGRYAGPKAVSEVRGITFLYQENIHLVVRKGSAIHSPADLKGKQVALGEEGSGTRVDALLVLKAYGVTEKDVQEQHLRLGPAIDALHQGTLDALFFVSAPPVGALAQFADSDEMALVPLAGPPAERLIATYPFLVKGEIPAGVYAGVAATQTISVGALLVCSETLSDDLVYAVTKALFHPANQTLLQRGHPAGKQIRLKTALTGMSVPLHPGAERYYREAGVLGGEGKPPFGDPSAQNEPLSDGRSALP